MRVLVSLVVPTSYYIRCTNGQSNGGYSVGLPEDTKLMILAPVVQDRKGEHVQLLEALRSQGFVRARIDGEIYELDASANLRSYAKNIRLKWLLIDLK